MAIQITNAKYIGKKKYCEISCTSTDEKPVGGELATGSILTEVDTGKVYFYNEDGNSGDGAWVEQFSFQG